MTIRLIGLNHGYQLRDCDLADWLSFEQYLSSYAQHRNIDLIAEELNDEAISKWKAADSVARYVARRLGINHLFCDPDSGQRRALGIQTFAEIAAQLGPNAALDLVEAKERESWPLREQFWLKTLREAPFTSCVFVLGSQHVKSFDVLLRSQGWEAAVVDENWEP